MSGNGATVIVLGGAGYIGSHTCLALAEAGCAPVIVDNFSSGNREACGSFEVEQADILDTAALTGIFKRHRPDAVIHFAALIEVGDSVKNPDAFFRNNVEGTRSVLAAMRAANVPNIIFSSTAAVYGQPQDDRPLTEDALLAPINPYGQSKLAAEWLIRAAGAAYGIKSVCLRYFNASGADTQGRTGEAHYPETHLVPLAIQAAQGLRDGIAIYGTDYPTPDGTCVRDYIHVADLARAHVLARDYLLKGGATTACNLGSGTGYSVNDIIQAVASCTPRNLNVRLEPRRPGDPAFLVADSAKAQSLLGWWIEKTLDDIVSSAWRWHESPLYRELWDKRSKPAFEKTSG